MDRACHKAFRVANLDQGALNLRHWLYKDGLSWNRNSARASCSTPAASQSHGYNNSDVVAFLTPLLRNGFLFSKLNAHSVAGRSDRHHSCLLGIAT